MRRRWLSAVCAALVLATVVPMVRDATAQQFGIITQGVIDWRTASVSINNSTAAKQLYQYTVPGALMATQAMANTTAASLIAQNSSMPLHLQLTGWVSIASGTLNCGANYGGGVTGVATIALANGLTQVVTQAPLTIDVWVAPIATGNDTTATPNIANTVFIKGRFAFPSTATPTYENSIQAFAYGTLPLASANNLNVICNTGSAATGNGVGIHDAVLKLGW